MTGPLRIAALHFTPRLAAPAENLPRLLELTRQAAAAADLVVLPELCTTGFVLTPGQAEAWAEPPEGPTVSALGQLARETGALIVAGLVLRGDRGLHNAQVVLDGSGRLLRVYAKHRLYGSDFAWARAGTEPGAVIETPIGRLGLVVCHDVVYDFVLATLAGAAPRVVALSTAWIGDGEPVPASWQRAVGAIDPAPLVVANRGGAEGDVRYEDPSLILSWRHGGRVGARGPEPYILRGELPG